MRRSTGESSKRGLLLKPFLKARAMSVHIYTASGVIFAFLAVAEICKTDPDARWVFLWLVVALLIDATDGPVARCWQVKVHLPQISGRTIDDIVDYLTYTFVPLLLVWRMNWLPQPRALWPCIALVFSLFGFANVGIKQEDQGFFVGFPSYWNIFAFYAGLWAWLFGTLVPAIVLLILSMLTVLPVRFLYPNMAPRPWRLPVMTGGVVWLALIAGLLPIYPAIPLWLMWISLIYPAFYVVLSVYLDLKTRRDSG
jgi:phosphatidylcholine synthase